MEENYVLELTNVERLVLEDCLKIIHDDSSTNDFAKEVIHRIYRKIRRAVNE